MADTAEMYWYDFVLQGDSDSDLRKVKELTA